MKKIGTLAMMLFLLGCGENSDGSDKGTYSSCSIIESKALLASDRARDVNQCWDGVNYREKSLAMDWCSKKVNSYMSRYTFGHDIKYQVSSTNCPNQNSNPSSTPLETSSNNTNNDSYTQPQGSNNRVEDVTYSISVTVETLKSNGQNWDIFGGEPDIKIYIDSKYQKLCKNSFECRLTYTSNKDRLTFTIYDKDVSADDFVGKGSCSVNDTCKLGQALVEINSY